MTLITILIAAGLQRFLGFGAWFKSAWFSVYIGWWRPVTSKLNNWLVILVIILPVLAVLGLVNYLLGGYFLGLVKLLFMVVILLGCLSAQNIKQELREYFVAMQKDDLSVAYNAAKDFIAGFDQLDEHKLVAHALIRTVTRAIFMRSFERIFAVLFWFIIFGSYGAVVYVMLNMLDCVVGMPEVKRLKGWIDWLPLRLLAVAFALTGHFVHEFSYCFKHCWGGIEASREFVCDLGLVALNVDTKPEKEIELAENYAAISLIDRSLIAWVVTVAIFTLGAWIS